MNEKHSPIPESDEIEIRLRQQSQPGLDPRWRRVILDAAFAEIEVVPSPVWYCTLQLRECLPLPLRIPLAAAWLLIAFFTLNKPDSSEAQNSLRVANHGQTRNSRALRSSKLQAHFLAFRMRGSIFERDAENLFDGGGFLEQQ